MSRRRVALVLAAGVLPWGVVAWSTGWYPVFSVGTASLHPVRFEFIVTYLSHAVVSPGWASWATGAFLYVFALASALLGDPDERVTAGLLALAGFSVLTYAWHVSGQHGVLVAPFGTLWLWGVVGLEYSAVLRGATR